MIDLFVFHSKTVQGLDAVRGNLEFVAFLSLQTKSSPLSSVTEFHVHKRLANTYFFYGTQETLTIRKKRSLSGFA